MLASSAHIHTDSTLTAAAFVLAPPAAPQMVPPLTVDKCDVWGTEFARLDMPQTVALADAVIQRRIPEYFVTANLNYLMLTDQHPRLHEVNQRSLAVIADGAPIVRRSRRSQLPLPCRVAGADMIVELARLAAERDYRIYFLGAPPGVAAAAAAELQRRFPRLQIAGCYSPPFRPLTSAEHAELLAKIRATQPDMLFVAFGQPKGELWIYDNYQELQVPLSIQLGASFDFLAGNVRRAPQCWQQWGCEWLYRALSDPRRLAPRYARNIQFLLKRVGADWLSEKSQ
jgi:N-acetylglucosaminyldiphosphoundecaprenol N-acetyl-beta-D-mannosaminyltransferase